MRAVDPDAQIASAKQLLGVTGEPPPEQIKAATEQLAQKAVTPFLKAAFRRRILEIRAQNEQTIDRHSVDDVRYAGFDAAAVDKAQAKVKDFRAWTRLPRSFRSRSRSDTGQAKTRPSWAGSRKTELKL